ncbi:MULTISPECIES: RNA polymerase factor sigma-54 [unclassified Erythrobacter]|uniref:RNA polymerase factor sigma-54 n=1 Tax=unclassified Erythrobacter TaxID=2633097 RepID=UPI00076CBE98|nr:MULTISPECIES: RNA polymerase factor sigma-54 [unclassified Erythrobacter]KWV93954.1 RNA polymerase sigma-54 factor [Erythrobacter sp. AP23]MBO6767018.1 RNA polymerase factor sigma-54 [Erythrobacter sp.]
MALSPRLDLRQTQSLVMTPQLQQAIKLLALSNLEIETFVSEALESNPLLEMGEVRREAGDETAPEPQEPDSATDMGGENALDVADHALDPEAAPGDMGDWSRGDIGSAGGGELPDLENRSAGGPTLAEHLTEQVGAAAHDAREALIAVRIIGELDEAGYLPTDLRVIAEELGVPLAEVERALATVQSLDPTGVGARSLAECLALQAREADRYDPCMARLIDNLDLVVKGDIARLKRMCEVDDEDFADMLAELRGYDPKPGLAFGGGAESAIVPDVLITPSAEGWDIRLNEASLPRLVVNREYYLELKGGARDKASQSWLNEQLGEADWLIRALDQRQKTILKTASEIVKKQEGFFREGVTAMRPLTLREVAEQIEMHESTVSRVTSNKYLSCPRGTFELKYFFSSGVAAADGEGASSEAIKARIKALCDAEDPKKVLSDQKLADMLNEEGFDLARRTVAKYREAIGIGSSAQRRREKKLQAL